MTTDGARLGVDHNRIAALVLSAYDRLPPRGAKPGLKSNNRLEWTVLAAFIVSFPDPSQDKEEYAVISLGTGLKCLPYASLSRNGDVLHDQHAEVLARRGARQWLLQRLHHEVKQGAAERLTLFESVGYKRDARRWKLRTGVRLHLYVSTLPCGDASNRLLEYQRAAQDQVADRKDMLTPAQLLEIELRGPSSRESAASGSVVRGRASSSHSQAHAAASSSGSLRTKPGRPDSPPSICMSCSDKIALWNAPGVGMQGSLLSSLLEPIYIASITICDHPTRLVFPAFPGTALEAEQRQALQDVLGKGCQQALQRGRPAEEGIVLGWSSIPFRDSKEAQTERAWSTFSAGSSPRSLAEQLGSFRAKHEPESCPNSILFISDAVLAKGKVENLATGTRMGASTRRPKSKETSEQCQPLKGQARSAVCRLSYFQSFVSVHDSIVGAVTSSGMLYSDAKAGAFGRGSWTYRRNKDDLLGHKNDALVESFLQQASRHTAVNGSIQTSQQTTMRSERPDGFKSWLRTPATFSHFDLDGRLSN